jgi:ketosteroid isomerase-like protein
VARLIEVFEALSPADVARLGEFYTEQAYFKDPFNEVNSLAAVQRIFRHMFDTLDRPRFVVHNAVAEGEQCLLTWDFLFTARGQAYTVRGSSHLRFAADGRVAYHRDYWDTSEELYEKLPVLGLLMRWLRRRLAS